MQIKMEDQMPLFLRGFEIIQIVINPCAKLLQETGFPLSFENFFVGHLG